MIQTQLHYYLRYCPRNNGQTTMPRMIFHQIKLAKPMVNSHPMNQMTPAPAPHAPLRFSIFLLLPIYYSGLFFSSGVYSNKSPGWQLRYLQMASSVENRIAFTLPVFRLDMFTFEIPTFSARSFICIFLSASTLSKRIIIAINFSLQCRIDLFLQIVAVLKNTGQD